MNACGILAARFSRVNTISTLIFSHRSNKIRICGLSGQVKQWKHGHELLAQRCLHVKSNSTKKFSANYKTDRVSEDFKLIYRSSIGPWMLMFRVYVGAICSCLVAVCSVSVPKFSSEFLTSQEGLLLSGLTGVFVLTMCVANIAARQFLLRIYYHDSGLFVGIQRSLFGRLKQLKYVAEDVKLIPSKSKAKKSSEDWDAINVVIQGKKIFLQSKDFSSPTFYNIHMGAFSNQDNILAQEPKF